jgi:hypothetical protein
VDRSLVLGVVLGLFGCSKPAPPAAERRSPATTSRHPTAPIAENPRDIGALFRVESESRPAGTLRAEQAFEAFRRAGLEVHDQRQHLGRPYGARYCVGAKSGTSLALSVCEYVDVEAARSGAEASRKIALAHREIRLNRATSLTVRQIEKTPESDALALSFFTAFDAAPAATR